jgi:hypothetical protein
MDGGERGRGDKSATGVGVRVLRLARLKSCGFKKTKDKGQREIEMKEALVWFKE